MTDGTQRRWVGFFCRPIAGAPRTPGAGHIGGELSIGGLPLSRAIDALIQILIQSFGNYGRLVFELRKELARIGNEMADKEGEPPLDQQGLTGREPTSPRLIMHRKRRLRKRKWPSVSKAS
jgi:hypothetical protein